MSNDFEDPVKTRMRTRCETAVDQTAHERVVDLQLIDLPPGAELNSRIKGDLQSVDQNGRRYCYYLRPNVEDVLPKWLAALARLAHELDDVLLYVVVEVSPSPQFLKSCEAAGAGLLTMDASDQFEWLLDFRTTLPEEIAEELASELKAVRRDMEAKLELRTAELSAQSQKVGELTKEMTGTRAAKYRQSIERNYQAWTEWGEALSTRLDAVAVTKDRAELDHIRAAIEIGVVESSGD